MLFDILNEDVADLKEDHPTEDEQIADNEDDLK